MNTREDEKWQSLLLRSTPTFAGETELPYGFMTSTLARLKSERTMLEECERIGWRALLASFAALIVAAAVTLTVNYTDQSGDFEPGIPGSIQMENIQVS